MSRIGELGQVFWGVVILIAYYFPSFDENTAGLIGFSLIPITAVILIITGFIKYSWYSRYRRIQ